MKYQIEKVELSTQTRTVDTSKTYADYKAAYTCAHNLNYWEQLNKRIDVEFKVKEV